jgi:pimeloyl-ACP methyl ester carboxylesterase
MQRLHVFGSTHPQRNEIMDRQSVTIDTDGLRVTGIIAKAEPSQPRSADTPLLVCIPGGSYTAKYFDVPGFSLLSTAAQCGFTTVALDRPGYAGSDALPEGDGIFARNAEVLDSAIGHIWSAHGSGRPGVVIISHSIGSAISVHLAARHPSWPLLGVALHGIHTAYPESVGGAMESMTPGQPAVFSTEQRRALMYGPASTFQADAVERAEVACSPSPAEELHEVVGAWPSEAPALAAEVGVPVHYVLSEYEKLWETGQGSVDTFAGYFVKSPRVDARLFHGSGHNIDHHHLGRALHLQQLAFALQCAQGGDVVQLP